MAGYKPITSTFLFKNLGGNVLTGKINEAATSGKRYSEQDLLEQFVQSVLKRDHLKKKKSKLFTNYYLNMVIHQNLKVN